MAQHDYNIANQTRPQFRADLNNVLAAVKSVNSGRTAPADPVLGMLWWDSADNKLKVYNQSGSWVTLFNVTGDGAIFVGDSDSYTPPLRGSEEQIFDTQTEVGSAASQTITLSRFRTAYEALRLDFASGETLMVDMPAAATQAESYDFQVRGVSISGTTRTAAVVTLNVWGLVADRDELILQTAPDGDGNATAVSLVRVIGKTYSLPRL